MYEVRIKINKPTTLIERPYEIDVEFETDDIGELIGIIRDNIPALTPTNEFNKEEWREVQKTIDVIKEELNKQARRG